VASIDGFLDHFDAEAMVRPATRASLRPVRSRGMESNEVRERALLWLLVALLHLLLILALRSAMQPLPLVRDTVVQPLQITFIQWTTSPSPRAAESSPPATHVAKRLTVGAILLTDDRQQAIAPAPPIASSASSQANPTESNMPSSLVIYDIDGRIRVPVAPASPTPANPFARRAASTMLPGSDHVLAPGIHVRAGGSPQKVVERIGAYLFGGGHFDPCPEYEVRLINADSAAESDEQMDRYARACPGR